MLLSVAEASEVCARYSEMVSKRAVTVLSKLNKHREDLESVPAATKLLLMSRIIPQLARF